jgi:hypothetical protein
MNGQIFINYRGNEGRTYAALLYGELCRRFGKKSVFLDSESIPAGADYVQNLLLRVRHATVVLAVIGPKWKRGMRRDSRLPGRHRTASDWTRRELVEAFAAGIPVIPVLTDDANLPRGRGLPPDLAPLARCQYRRLRCGEATTDLDRIATDLTTLQSALTPTILHRDSAMRHKATAKVAVGGQAARRATVGRTTPATAWHNNRDAHPKSTLPQQLPDEADHRRSGRP